MLEAAGVKCLGRILVAPQPSLDYADRALVRACARPALLVMMLQEPSFVSAFSPEVPSMPHFNGLSVGVPHR